MPPKDEANKCLSYDEAIDKTGYGRYTITLVAVCGIIVNAVAVDMFGFAIIVAACSCDLKMDYTQMGLLASAPFAGVLFAFPWGYFADARGRRGALMISTAGGFLFSALSSFSPNFETMLVLKIVGCSFSFASNSLTMTYLGECASSKKRDKYMSVVNSCNLASEIVSFSLAFFILPLKFNFSMGWIRFRPWRLLCLIFAMPMGLGSLAMVLLEESPKFLVSRGQHDKALEVLKIMYETNGGKDFQIKYIVQENLSGKETDESSPESFITSFTKQTWPIFKPPLLWRTLQMFYLYALVCATNNVFAMWLPSMVNSFFISFNNNSTESSSFCDRLFSNATKTIENYEAPCNETISTSTIITGFAYGLFYAALNLSIAYVARHRRLVLNTSFLVSALSCILLVLLKNPIASVIFFTLLQNTAVCLGVVASYFVDFYPTSCRALAGSLSLMMGRLATLVGVNIVGSVITHHCDVTFIAWAVFVMSGVGITLLLPADGSKKGWRTLFCNNKKNIFLK